MSYALSHPEPGGSASAILSLLVHGIFLSVLFFGLRWQSKHPDTVAVELWSQLPALEQAPEPQPEVKPEPKPEPKIEPKPEPKRDLKMETKLAPVPKVESPSKKPDIAVEREKKTQKKKIEKKIEPPLKFNENQRIREQLEQEERALRQTPQRDAAKVSPPPPSAAPALDRAYADRIRGKIKGNIVLPPDISGNPEAIFDVKMLPGGEVSDVKLRKSSGHRLYDEAVERAIWKSSPLPLPERREQFQRELKLTFKPKE